MAKPNITATTKPAAKKAVARRATAKAAAPALVSRSVPVKTVAAADAKPARKATYGALVRRLAKEYGVKVAAAPAASPFNPYSVSEAVTKKALKSVGVLNRQGKLASHLK